MHRGCRGNCSRVGSCKQESFQTSDDEKHIWAHHQDNHTIQQHHHHNYQKSGIDKMPDSLTHNEFM